MSPTNNWFVAKASLFLSMDNKNMINGNKQETRTK